MNEQDIKEGILRIKESAAKHGAEISDELARKIFIVTLIKIGQSVGVEPPSEWIKKN